ncbi:aldehyde dehydrogenase family protein [Nocardia macrotermitis]|uniref:Putative succinate-semialdehyde dehydrogenase [NADP(+)] 2 n=1 Tax=Nocardia macrotermitis TaxID=2585198 RepID=A0A7K0DE89_9NOCA|nr:aldehyde dehydrogenase family protein [Nocardia macrotermitis]MQY23184.1 putative succinate-semialdehyde dehydrogenase [NADP(+)] 2 [Nocardia macrotermitis]
MLSIPSNAARDSWITVTAPADGRILGTLPMHTPDRVHATVAQLREAQSEWRAMGVVGRVHWLTAFRDWLLDNEDPIAALLAAETGRSATAAHQEFRLGIDTLDYHRTRGADFLSPPRTRAGRVPGAALRLAVAHRPCAVAGVISSWTAPMATPLLDAVPALLAGSAVVAKPSSVTPLTMRALVTGWLDLGAPPVFEFVAGPESGAAVVDTVDAVHFNGSPETGKVVALRAAGRLIPCGLDIGGKSAAVVLAGADIGRAATGIALGGLAGSGQSCASIERVFVESAIYDEFLDRLVEEVLAFGSHDPDDSTVEVMTSAAHVDNVRDQIADAIVKGARVRVGGNGEGQIMQPTVLADADPAMAVLTQQTLGPVLPVVRVADAEQAIALANEPFAPCASVWTADDAAADDVWARLTAARIAINDVSVHLATAFRV